jgi:hypothetical protein
VFSGFFRFGCFDREGEGLLEVGFCFPPLDGCLGEGLAVVPSPEQFFRAVFKASFRVAFCAAFEWSASLFSTIWSTREAMFWALTGGSSASSSASDSTTAFPKLMVADFFISVLTRALALFTSSDFLTFSMTSAVSCGIRMVRMSRTSLTTAFLVLGQRTEDRVRVVERGEGAEILGWR